MEISNHEKKFIKRYYNVGRSYLLLLLFVVIIVIIHYCLIFKRVLPFYRILFAKHPNIYEAFYRVLLQVYSMSFIWVILIISFLIGSYYTFIKMRRLLLKIEKELKQNGSKGK